MQTHLHIQKSSTTLWTTRMRRTNGRIRLCSLLPALPQIKQAIFPQSRLTSIVRTKNTIAAKTIKIYLILSPSGSWRRLSKLMHGMLQRCRSSLSATLMSRLFWHLHCQKINIQMLLWNSSVSVQPTHKINSATNVVISLQANAVTAQWIPKILDQSMITGLANALLHQSKTSTTTLSSLPSLIADG